MALRKVAARPIVLRRVTLQTRKRFAQLSKERQGQDGKWESNKKKAAFRLARKKCSPLDGLLKHAHERGVSEQAQALTEAAKLVKELKKVSDLQALLKIVDALETLPVSAKLLKRTLLPRVLNDATQKFPAALGASNRLRQRWRDAFREDLAKLKAAASSPSVAVATAKALQASSAAASSMPAPSAAASRSASALRPTPAASTPAARAAASAAAPAAAMSAAVAGAAAVQRGLTRRRSASVSSTSSSSSSDSVQEVVAASAGAAGASSSASGAAASTPVQAAPRMVATPVGKPNRKQPRQLRLTAFLKPGGV
mmetsp:Transcript_90652/g.259259  ORF Transcript_90652/g.259259 Transcript_90652/m.259259 type:complete len:312 (-) Transcript_90652:49-984(-)